MRGLVVGRGPVRGGLVLRGRVVGVVPCVYLAVKLLLVAVYLRLVTLYECVERGVVGVLARQCPVRDVERRARVLVCDTSQQVVAVLRAVCCINP